MFFPLERKEIIEAAIESVKQEFAQQKNAAKKASMDIDDTQRMHHSFKMATKESLEQGYARLKFERMVRAAESKILQKSRQQAASQTTEEHAESLAVEFLHTPGSLLTKEELAKMAQESECRKIADMPPNCPSQQQRQRTANGVCNNLQHPTRGAASTRMRRLIPSRYDDGISRLQGTFQIRGVSIVPGPFSPPTPSPRVVSLGVVLDKPLNDTRLSHILMQWGQFMDHDLDAIPEFEECPQSCEVNEDSCVPFPVPEDDTDVLTTRAGRSRSGGGGGGGGGGGVRSCHAFRRSLPACDPEDSEHELEPREQINSITHFIDGSMVYHHDPNVQANLIRNQSSPDGLLNVGPPVRGKLENFSLSLVLF